MVTESFKTPLSVELPLSLKAIYDNGSGKERKR